MLFAAAGLVQTANWLALQPVSQIALGDAASRFHAKNSFVNLILPHVDQAMMKTVQATDWLRPEDGTDILPPDPTGAGSGQGIPLGSGPRGSQIPAPGAPGGAGPGGAGPGSPGLR